jgi:hypothetical protein
MTISELKKMISDHVFDEARCEMIHTYIDLAYVIGEKNATIESLKIVKRIIKEGSRKK